tara:strand:- start:119 stop:1099 length:981 start_codon:yes stop_codon:yes gene_type:complete
MSINWGAVEEFFAERDAKKERDEQLVLEREEFLLKLGYSRGGGNSNSNKKIANAAEKAFIMQDRLDKSGITDETTLNWYGNLFTDPIATADAHDFIEDQAKNYDRNINLRDMPALSAIVPADIPVKEKIDLLKEFEIVDLTNNEEFYKLAERVNNMTSQSGRTVFLDINPEAIQKTDYTAREKQLDSVRKNVIRTARAGLDNNPDKIETLNALNNLSSSNAGTRDDAEVYLFSRFITPEFIASLEEENESFYRGLSKHPNLTGYIKESMVTTPQNKIYPEPSSADITLLKQNKNSDVYKNFFDETYGPGAADKALGDTKRTGPSGL